MSEEKSLQVHKTLPDPIELAKEAWILYKARFWTIVGISVIGVISVLILFLVLAIIGAILFFVLGAKPSPQIIIIGVILVLLFILLSAYLSYWAMGSIYVSLKNWKEREGIREVIKKSRPYVLPLVGTSILLGVLTFGSFFLLVIPLFIFEVWFTFSRLVVVTEKKSGLLALHTSREYVKGRFWGVLWRMIALYLPMFILSFLVGRSGKSGPITGLYHILSLLVIPFYTSYTYVLFSHLQKTAEKVTTVPRTNKLVYLLIPLLGYVIVIISSIILVPLALRSAAQFGAAMVEKQQGPMKNLKPSTQIVNGLVVYYLANKQFPKTLDEVKSVKMLPKVPSDPETGLPYRYTQVDNGSNFKLCTPLTVKPEKCVSAESKNFDL